ncbi:MAG: s-methyl-5-thioribose-1-phosphate isomerase [Firmicutes bacterium]|nr:s-methyl-5-thioribose-1-phosphate isomerase [Bacillota bacterium]
MEEYRIADREPLMLHIDYSVFLRDDGLVVVDRRLLPGEVVEVVCTDSEAVARCIKDMVVQGAGDIAITAGYGLYLAARSIEAGGAAGELPVSHLYRTKEMLVGTRPTGFHLAALLDRIIQGIDWEAGDWSGQILKQVRRAVEKQRARSERTGFWAETLLVDGDVILTHCFPGPALLYMLKFARDKGKKIRVYSTETRPYLQGARLTAWSVSQLGIGTTLITDNMAAYCMQQGLVKKVFTAADRIAMDGTVANKVGTFQLALAASYHHLPFYILGYGGPDTRTRRGEEIRVEVRDPEEVLRFQGVRITGEEVAGFYPAFDLTPPQLVTAVITDRGIIPPGDMGSYWDKE